MRDQTRKLTPYVSHWLLQRIADPTISVAPGQTYNFDAAILIMDVIDSTLLADQLTREERQGIEALDRAFDFVFSSAVKAARALGGDATHFSGDAVACMWSNDNPAGMNALDAKRQVLCACTAALATQMVMKELEPIETPEGPTPLSVRIGVGYGPIQAMILGNDDQCLCTITGEALDGAFQAENGAAPNRPRLHPEVIEILGAAADVDTEEHLVSLNVPIQPTPIRTPPVDEDLLRPFIHPILINREFVGRRDLVAEFRPVTPMFIRCTGPGKPEEWLNAWVQKAQNCINGFGGWLSSVEVIDRESVLIATFGAPIAHEDDERRAVACALALQDAANSLPHALHPRIGITQGRLFASTIGAPERHAYTLIGNEINLASRLAEMAQPVTTAGARQILISESVYSMLGESTPHQFAFHNLGSMPVRGKREPMRLYSVTKSSAVKGPKPAHPPIDATTERRPNLEQKLVGREREMATAEKVMEQTWAEPGKAHLLTIGGEAGIGKSRLASEIARRWIERGGFVAHGDCLPTARETPYLPWRWIIAERCDIEPQSRDDPRAVQIERIAHALAQLPAPQGQSHYWTIRLPLLAEALGMEVEDNDLTRALSGQSRRDNTFAVIQALLEAEGQRHPILVLMEDAHWADELSLQLMTHLVRNTQAGRILLLLAYRPLSEPRPEAWHVIEKLPRHISIELGELNIDASQTLVQDQLGGARVPDALVDLVFERAHGHPLFTEEIIHMFQDVDAVHVRENKVAFDRQRITDTYLPKTVRGVVQARVDQLEEESRLTLKVASVIGRIFPYPVLAGVYPAPIENFQLQTHLDTAERMGLTLLERRAPDREYIFKHSITRDVVYESLAFAQRRELHEAVARWYERRHADNLEPFYSLLAYHYAHTLNRERELHYVMLAAEHAERTHAVAEAIGHYERALELLDQEQEPARTADVLMELGRGVHYVTGQYDRSLNYFHRALALYEKLNASIHVTEACFEIADRLSVHDLGEATRYVMRGLEAIQDNPEATHQIVIAYTKLAAFQSNRGNYWEAKASLDQALALAQESGDLKGLRKCYSRLSIYHHSQGERQEAFEAGAQVIRYLELTDPSVENRIIALNNQACFAQKIGAIEEAIEAGERGMDLAKRAGVISEQVILASSLAGIYNHVGDWDAARRVLEQGLLLLEQHPHPYHEVALHLEVGDTAYGRGEGEQAIEHWSLAEEQSRTGAQQMFTAELRARLARAWIEIDLKQAERWAKAARSLAEERGQRGALASAYRSQGLIERARGTWEAGVVAFERSLALTRELNDDLEEARTLLAYGHLLVDAGHVEEGRSRLRQAEEQASALKLHPVAGAARAALETAS